MTVLTDLKEELVGLLEGGNVPAVEYVPRVVNPPVGIISASEPYIQEVFNHKTFDHDYKVTLEIRLVAVTAGNEDATKSLDALIVQTLVALQNAWECDVSQPFLYEVSGTKYLAADVTINTSITIA